jgi:hypothetical protein
VQTHRFFRTLAAFAVGVVAMVLSAPIAAAVLLFAAISALTRRLAVRFEPRISAWDEVIAFDPTIGWKSKPNLRTYCLADDVFQITTDADGWRGTDTTLADAEVVVVGDSHAYGHGIDDRDFFGHICRVPRVKAIGVSGYNMVQELLLMQQVGAHLANKIVVWFIFLGNDLADNLEPSMMQYRTPFVRLRSETGRWEIVTDHLSPEPWPFIMLRYREVNYDRLTKICSPSFVSDRAFAACEYLIAEGASLCERARARLIVMTIQDPKMITQEGLRTLYAHGADPQCFDPTLPDRRVRSICDRLGIPFIAGADHFTARDFKERDDHWNQRGHRRMADILRRLCEDDLNTTTREAVMRQFPVPVEN